MHFHQALQTMSYRLFKQGHLCADVGLVRQRVVHTGFSLRQHRGTYLWVLQTSEVRVQVELDASRSTWQRHTTNQQHDEHDKRERGCDVDHLREIKTQRSNIMEKLQFVFFYKGKLRLVSF